MATLTVAEAFAKFGGKPANRLHSLSAIAADGSLILRCSSGQYGHPAAGVLRYEDRLSGETKSAVERVALGQHLEQARTANLPIRMIVVTAHAKPSGAKGTQTIHVRSDLVGKLVEFDGDRFVVDFTRVE